MKADVFYEEFKYILNQLGVGFTGKEHAEVFGELTMSAKDGDKTITINLVIPPSEPPKV